MRLWLNTARPNPCEQSRPSSGEWTVRNREQRTVRVTLRRTVVRGGVSHEDLMRDTLDPGEARALGCELSEDGRVQLVLVSAVY